MIDIPSALEERYGKSHLSYSSLKVALTDMAQFDLYMKREMKFESPALAFGTMYDMMLFEPDKVNQNYYIMGLTHQQLREVFEKLMRMVYNR